MIRTKLLTVFALSFALIANASVLRKYGVSTTVFFPLFEPAAVNYTTAAVCATGDVKISKNGAAFANTTNCFVSEGEGMYSVGLTAAEMQSSKIVVAVKDLTATKVWLDDSFTVDTYGNVLAEHAFDLDSLGNASSQLAIYQGTVNDEDFAPSATQFQADVLDSQGITPTLATAGNPTADNHFNGRVILWVTGELSGQAATITNFELADGRGQFTVSAMTEAPSLDDEFVIL